MVSQAGSPPNSVAYLGNYRVLFCFGNDDNEFGCFFPLMCQRPVAAKHLFRKDQTCVQFISVNPAVPLACTGAEREEVTCSPARGRMCLQRLPGTEFPCSVRGIVQKENGYGNALSFPFEKFICN